MSGAEPSWDEIRVRRKELQHDDNPPDAPLSTMFRRDTFIPPAHGLSPAAISPGRISTALRPIGIISEGLARELWGSPQAAIGKHFQEFTGTPWHEVVGVVQDVRENGVDQVSPATVYWPSLMGDASAPQKQRAWRTVYFAMRTRRAGTQAFINEMQRAVWSVNANLPVADISTMKDLYSDSMARTSFTLVMLAIAGSMALALGILGIYGVISYAVSQRTREIGIRMALGARKSELVWMFVRSALLLTAIGTALGLGTAATLMRLMRTLLFGISPLDPITFTVVPLFLVAAAALASYLPARRTTAVDPVDALRAE